MHCVTDGFLASLAFYHKKKVNEKITQVCKATMQLQGRVQYRRKATEYKPALCSVLIYSVKPISVVAISSLQLDYRPPKTFSPECCLDAKKYASRVSSIHQEMLLHLALTALQL